MKRNVYILTAVLLLTAPFASAGEAPDDLAELMRSINGETIEAPAADTEMFTLGAYIDEEIPEAPSGLALLGRLLGSLVIVLGLIVVTAFVLKRMLAKSKFAPGGGMIQVVQAMPLGGKRQIYLIKVAGRVLVVGATGENMSALADLPEADVIADAETVQSALAETATPAPAKAAGSKASEFLGLLGNAGRQLVARRAS